MAYLQLYVQEEGEGEERGGGRDGIEMAAIVLPGEIGLNYEKMIWNDYEFYASISRPAVFPSPTLSLYTVFSPKETDRRWEMI